MADALIEPETQSSDLLKWPEYGYSRIMSAYDKSKLGDKVPSLITALESLSPDALEEMVYDTAEIFSKRKYENASPIFTNIRVGPDDQLQFEVNKKVVPWVAEYSPQTRDELRYPGTKSGRGTYTAAVSRTGSSIYSLIAVSVGDSRARGKLFHILASSLLESYDRLSDSVDGPQRLESVFLGKGLTPALVQETLMSNPDRFPGLAFDSETYEAQYTQDDLYSWHRQRTAKAREIRNKMRSGQSLTTEDLVHMDELSYIFNVPKIFTSLVEHLTTEQRYGLQVLQKVGLELTATLDTHNQSGNTKLYETYRRNIMRGWDGLYDQIHAMKESMRTLCKANGSTLEGTARAHLFPVAYDKYSEDRRFSLFRSLTQRTMNMFLENFAHDSKKERDFFNMWAGAWRNSKNAPESQQFNGWIQGLSFRIVPQVLSSGEPTYTLELLLSNRVLLDLVMTSDAQLQALFSKQPPLKSEEV